MIQSKQGLVLTGSGRKRRWRKRDSAATISAGIIGGGGAYLARREHMRSQIYPVEQIRGKAELTAKDATRLKGVAEAAIRRQNGKIANAMTATNKLPTKARSLKEIAHLNEQVSKAAHYGRDILENRRIEQEAADQIQKVLSHRVTPGIAGGIGAGVAAIGTIAAINHLHHRRVRKAARNAAY